VTCCNNRKTTEEIFDHFDDIREKMLKLTPEELLDQYLTVLPIDHGCKFNMGKKDEYFTPTERNNSLCSMCKVFSRLYSPEKSSKFCIECGSMKGKRLQVIRSTTPDTFLVDSGTHRKVLIGCAEDDACLKKVQFIDYLGGDVFTTNLLISWILEEKLYKHRTILNTYAGFICGDEVFTITERVDYKNMTELMDAHRDNQAELIEGILLQVVASLDKIHDMLFNFNRIDYNSIGFKDRPNNYKYGDVDIKCPVTVKMSGFGRSSLMYKGRRLIHDADYNRVYTYKRTITPKIKSFTVEKEELFMLDRETISYYYYDEINTPIMPPAINIYVIWIMLMTNVEVYELVNSDLTLQKVWRGIWIGTDAYKKINDRIVSIHRADGDPSFVNILEVIEGIYLRCNVSDYIIEKYTVK